MKDYAFKDKYLYLQNFLRWGKNLKDREAGKARETATQEILLKDCTPRE